MGISGQEHDEAWRALAQAGTGGEEDRPFWLLFEKPPTWLVLLWVVGTSATVATTIVSGRHIAEHAACAREVGFQPTPFSLFAFGPRGNRLIQLLLLTPIFAGTALAQLFFPSCAGLALAARTVHLSIAMLNLLDLIYLLAGGGERMEAKLSKEPVTKWAAPPLCCVFGWSRCAAKVTEDDVRLMTLGVQQFVLLSPIFGVLEAYWTTRLDELDTRLRVAAGLNSATTFLGIWSFKNLLNLVRPAYKKLVRHEGTKSKEMYVLLQIISTKLVGIFLKLGLNGGYKNDDYWEISRTELAAVIVGAYMCIVELFLSLLGVHAFPANDRVYPPADFEDGLPLDTLALLQMYGVKESSWASLRAARDAMGAESSSSESEEEEEDNGDPEFQGPAE